MATNNSNAIPFPVLTMVAVTAPRASNRRRRIAPQAGRALEILGHAIEYLTDEYVELRLSDSAPDGHLDAVRMLMAINRRIYFECPEVPTLSERARAIFRLDAA